MQRLMIIGGTFNPIHNGHLKAAVELEKMYHPDRLVFVPTGTPPHKRMGQDYVPGEMRLEMTRQALEGFCNYRVSDVEVLRGGKSYTIDTLEHVRTRWPGYHIYLVMGSDMLLTFEQWHRFQEIFPLCTIVAASREKAGRPILEQAAERYRQQYGADIDVVDVDPVEISSTQVRQMLRAGQDVSGLIPAGALRYIQQHGLYVDKDNRKEQK